jgi:hypothetical protein
MPEKMFTALHEDYLPFRLYTEHKRGATPAQLAATFSLSEPWIEERLEAVRLCVEKQIRVEIL